jgi:hypothetical protein
VSHARPSSMICSETKQKLPQQDVVRSIADNRHSHGKPAELLLTNDI